MLQKYAFFLTTQYYGYKSKSIPISNKACLLYSLFGHGRLLSATKAQQTANDKREMINIHSVMVYPTEQPAVTKSLGVSSTRRPSLSSAERIMPSLTTPLSLRRSKLAMKQTCLPTSFSGSV